MSIEDHKVSFSLEINTEQADTSMRKLYATVYRTLNLIERMGLPPEVTRFLREIEKMIRILNQLRLAMLAVQAAAGPIGWAYAAVSVATFAVSASDSFYQDTRGT